jgi:hypothetical protein
MDRRFKPVFRTSWHRFDFVGINFWQICQENYQIIEKQSVIELACGIQVKCQLPALMARRRRG